MVNESGAAEITWSELSAKLTDRNGCKSDEVYLVSEKGVILPDTKYYGNGCTVIFTGGIEISGVSNAVIKEMIIKGDVILDNSDSVTVFEVGIVGNVTVGQDARDISFKSCRIESDQTAIDSRGDNVTFYKCFIGGKKGIVSTGGDLAIQSTEIIADEIAISSAGEDILLRNNVIEASVSGEGISIGEESQNVLVAHNVIRRAQASITVVNSTNAVILLNSAISVNGKGNRNLYVVENSLGGLLGLEGNEYLLCDGNSFNSDGKDHSVISLNNSKYNGDDLEDQSARTTGAEESLLPETNKDLFISMERKTVVRDISTPESYSFNSYVRSVARERDVVIIPPGAYTVSSTLLLDAAHSDTTVYAFGVYQESADYGSLISLERVRRFTVKGLTMGYVKESSGQIHVVAKRSGKLLCVAGAGFSDDFTKTNTDKFNPEFCDIFLDGALYPSILMGDHHDIVKSGDRSFILTPHDEKIYNIIRVGDVLSTRIAGDNGHSVSIKDSKNILFKDSTLYGYSASLAVTASGDNDNIEFYRWHNTSRSAPVIDKAIYDKYVALEKEYGVNLEVYTDGEGRYRGSLPRVGSVDAFHISGSKEGVNVTSSILESMCDDASNQRGYSARLHKIEDMGNGVSRIYFKSNLGQVYYEKGKTQGSLCHTVSAGDNVRIYTSEGRELCNTYALSNQEHFETIGYQLMYGSEIRTYSAQIHYITVKTSALDLSVLTKADGSVYDLNDNGFDSSNKVYVDNLSYNSSGFTFDNLLIQNTRSRGVLIKSTNTTIKNCTLRNLAHAGILINSEPQWSESTVPHNILIADCVFDNCGFKNGEYDSTLNAPISIVGLGELVYTDSSLVCTGITVESCSFINNKNIHAISALSAQNLTIRNNLLGKADSKGALIALDTVKNVEISGNTYPPDITGGINVVANNYINVFGSDITASDFEDDFETASTESETVTETESETVTETESETVTETESETVTETESETATETESETATETESETVTETESETATETESETVTETESETETETEPEPTYTYYRDPDTLLSYHQWGGNYFNGESAVEIKEENGVRFVSYKHTGATGALITFSGAINMYSDVERFNSGSFIVVKYRVSTGFHNIRLQIGTSDRALSDVWHGFGQEGHGSWQIAVVDLASVSTNYEANTEISRICLQFTTGCDAGATLDIEYVAIVKSIDDLGGFVTDDVCTRYPQGFDADGRLIYTESGACYGGCVINESASDNTYVATCLTCGCIYSKTVDAFVNKYYGVSEVCDSPVDVYLVSSRNKLYDPTEKTSFTRFTTAGNVFQIAYSRSDRDGQSRPVSVGNAEYMVIKLRSKGVTSLELKLGTTVDGSASAYNGCNIPVSAMPDGEWVTFVINIKAVFGDAAWNASSDGSYYLTFLELTAYLDADDYLDISHYAFCDTFDEAQSAAYDTSVQYMTGNNISQTVDVNTQS